MNRELILLVLSIRLLGNKSLEALQADEVLHAQVRVKQEEFRQHMAVFNESTSCLSLLPRDLTNCVLLYVLKFYQPHKGETLLHFAVGMELDSLVCHLMASGADKNSSDTLGRTPLLYAAMNGYCAIVERLGQFEVDIDKADDEGMTPLLYAAMNGHCVVVERLLLLGAAVDKADNYQRRPLHYAVKGEHISIVQELLKAGADINKRDSWGFAPLNWAVRGHCNMVEVLLAAGVAVDGVYPGGITPLMHAVLYKRADMIARLLRAGANKHRPDSYGRTAMDFAAEVCTIEVVFALLAHAM